MGWLTDLLRGGADELSWDDLTGKVVEALAKCAHYGARGEVRFAPALRATLAVPGTSAAVARGFVADPRFDREVGAALANRCDVAVSALPLREYAIEEAERFGVQVAELASRAWQLVIEGGDLSGRVVTVPAGGERVFGRGDSGGGGGKAVGELAICERTAFVSRRAGSLCPVGGQLELCSLDQGDLLQVRRANGEVVRPARTARGKVPVGEGDVIELSDGRTEVLRLRLRRAPSAEPDRAEGEP
jgi:hypothetical protein